MHFLDEAQIQVVGGDGGNGCIAFRREKYVPRGGPSGGNGGDGGSVWLRGDAGRNTLFHLRGRLRYPAERGRHGEGSDKTGRTGEDLEVRVPVGTIVYDRDTGALLGEVLRDGERLRVAAGGRGGRGNASFKTATRRAPRHAEPGGEGDDRWLRLELKLLADIGLVGFPNAGKSTLIRAVSAARPKIADYPFTTLVPQLGVVAGAGDAFEQQPFVIADLPGLIEGAADGAGLGFRFLRHVERCRVLMHVVDLSGSDRGADDDSRHTGDAAQDLAVLEDELRRFDPTLLGRSRVVLGSKVDAALDERRDALRRAAAARDLPYLEASAVTRAGLDALVHRLRQQLAEAPRLDAPPPLDPDGAPAPLPIVAPDDPDDGFGDEDGFGQLDFGAPGAAAPGA